MSEIANRCVQDVISKMVATKEFGLKKGSEVVFSVYSEDDLFDKTKLAKFPGVGVLYDGIRANGDDPSRQGLAADINIALVLLLNGKSVGGINQTNEAARILDAMRNSFNSEYRTSPSGHKWKFISEEPAGQINGLLMFIQRWSCPIILT